MSVRAAWSTYVPLATPQFWICCQIFGWPKVEATAFQCCPMRMCHVCKISCHVPFELANVHLMQFPWYSFRPPVAKQATEVTIAFKSLNRRKAIDTFLRQSIHLLILGWNSGEALCERYTGCRAIDCPNLPQIKTFKLFVRFCLIQDFQLQGCSLWMIASWSAQISYAEMTAYARHQRPACWRTKRSHRPRVVRTWSASFVHLEPSVCQWPRKCPERV